MRTLFVSLLLLPLFLSVSLASHSQDSTRFNNDSLTGPGNYSLSSSNNLNGRLEDTPSFLPVEQAFQLSIIQQDDQLLLNWNIAPAYYLYKNRFALKADDQGSTITSTITLTPRFEPGTFKYDEYFEKELEVFYQQAKLSATLPKELSTFTLNVQSQGCADAGLCYPPQTQSFHIDTTSGNINAIDNTPPGAPGSLSQSAFLAETGEQQLAWLPYIILLALAGGAILNLMPCVFPVLSIKALSLASASQNNHRQHLHGWIYTLGVVSAFVAVAMLMLAARAGGQAVGWGFQLQSPLLVSLLAYLFFAMGLSLSGLVTFGTKLMGLGQDLTTDKGLRGSFFTGVLAAVVASPCTAPFMGTALGYALTQPAFTSLSIFAALGFGMALPFLLLSYTPHLGKYLPQTGPWMDTLKQCLAFPLYLAAIWLLWVLGRQSGSDSVAAVCVGALLIAFAFWLSHHPIKRKSIQVIIAGSAMIAALWIPFQLNGSDSKTDSSHWQAYSPAVLDQLQAEGRPVFVNLTADWCLTCLANERLTLHTETIKSAFDELGFTTLKGDWTNYNADITALLNKYGRSGVPLYLVFPADSSAKAEILPQLLTQDMLLEALNRNSAGTFTTNDSKLTSK